MATVPKTLGAGYLPIATTTLYTVPAKVSTKLSSISVCNNGAGAATMDWYLVPPGGTAGGSNQFINGSFTSLQPLGDSRTLPILIQTLSSGYTIQAKSNTVSSIAYIISGTELSGDGIN